MREVTLLLTDVEGSTRLWEQRPDAMWRVLGRHDALFADVVGAHGGRVIKPRGEGDSMFCVFSSAPAAVRCALVLQQRLHDPGTWAPDPPLRVRMSVHTGPVHERDEDLYGPTVNRAARLRGTAHGGQVVVSQTTKRLVDDALPGQASLTDLGEHRLKDLLRPERAWQLCHPAIPEAFGPLRSLDPRRHNLPVLHTALIGRDDEIAVVAEAAGRHRLVTLTGGPGVGKTRLALQAAAEAVQTRPDGVWLVELASVTDERLVCEAAVGQLGLEAKADARAVLLDWLAPRKALVVLDNCEHLAAACARLILDVLAAAPDVVVVATSREPLAVPGERVVPVGPLEVPHEDAREEAAASCASVRLFMERAASSGATSLALEPVTRICSALDGIPLAIELAAARTRHLPVSAIADSLREVIFGDVLQQAIDWSYRLLTRSERTLLRRLTVFRGGAQLEAIEQVCGEDIADESTGLITRLVDRSLVQMLQGARYRLLEPVREFASERLTPPERDAVADAHTSYFTRFAQRVAAGLDSRGDVECVHALDADLDNLRVALEADCVPIASSLGTFWLRRGLWREGQRWLNRALDLDPDDPTLLLARGRITNRLGAPDAAVRDLHSALTGARSTANRPLEARSLHALAVVAFDQDNLDEAKQRVEKSRQISESIGDDPCTAQSLNLLGSIAGELGDLDAAERFFEQWLQLRRDEESREGIGVVLMNLGNIAAMRERIEDAERLYAESLLILREVGQDQIASLVLRNASRLAHAAGHHDKARLYLSESREIAARIGDSASIRESDQLWNSLNSDSARVHSG